MTWPLALLALLAGAGGSDRKRPRSPAGAEPPANGKSRKKHGTTTFKPQPPDAPRSNCTGTNEHGHRFCTVPGCRVTCHCHECGQRKDDHEALCSVCLAHVAAQERAAGVHADKDAARQAAVQDKAERDAKRQKLAADKVIAKETDQQRATLFSPHHALKWWLITLTATGINAPACWFALHKQALDDEDQVLQCTGVVEVGKKDGLRHHHYLIQARTSADTRRFAAFCNDVLASQHITTKFQIKKTASQTPQNIESILICLAKDLKVPSAAAHARQPPGDWTSGAPCVALHVTLAL